MPKVADLYQSHASAIYWAAYSITHNEHTAMDIMQSVFVRALEHTGTLSCLAPGQARSWLFTTARNASIDAIRKQKREFPTEEEFALPTLDESTLPEAAAITAAQREAICAAIDTLPEKYRQPILLYYFAGMPQSEIAAYLELNDSTLRSLLHRAKAKLLHCLEEGGALLD